jgi:adenylosuccinate synthase
MLDKGMICIPGRTEWNHTKFHSASQNGKQFKTHKLFISEISHLIFSNHSELQVNEQEESETIVKRGTTM